MQSPVPGILETPVDKALETWSVRVNTALRRRLEQGLPGVSSNLKYLVFLQKLFTFIIFSYVLMIFPIEDASTR